MQIQAIYWMAESNEDWLLYTVQELFVKGKINLICIVGSIRSLSRDAARAGLQKEFDL